MYTKIILYRSKLIADTEQLLERLADAANIRIADRREETVLQAISAMFGRDFPNNQERFADVLDNIMPLLLKPQNAAFLEQIEKHLSLYTSSWTASGGHRLIIVGNAIFQAIKGENIFKIGISDPEQVKYLKEKHPYYAYPSDLDPKYLPTGKKELYLSLSQNPMTLFDIGSAPKSDGPPTLLSMQKILPDIRYIATDISFPMFEINEGIIAISKYVEVRDGQIIFKPQTNINQNMLAINARVNEGGDIYSDEFLDNQSLQFITMCMVWHHLTDKSTIEELKYQPITSYQLIDEEGLSFNDQAKLWITDMQRKNLDKLLSKLVIGGIAFLDLHVLNYDAEYIDKVFSESNNDLFFVFQRVDKTSYRIYAQKPLVFRPENDFCHPSKERDFIRGFNEYPIINHGGITSYYSLSEEQISKLEQLFYRADVLALHYQAWKKSIWGRIHAVILAIRNESDVLSIFETYLANVPDNDSADARLKQELLKEVAALNNVLERR